MADLRALLDDYMDAGGALCEAVEREIPIDSVWVLSARDGWGAMPYRVIGHGSSWYRPYEVRLENRDTGGRVRVSFERVLAGRRVR